MAEDAEDAAFLPQMIVVQGIRGRHQAAFQRGAAGCGTDGDRPVRCRASLRLLLHASVFPRQGWRHLLRVLPLLDQPVEFVLVVRAIDPAALALRLGRAARLAQGADGARRLLELGGAGPGGPHAAGRAVAAGGRQEQAQPVRAAFASAHGARPRAAPDRAAGGARLRGARRGSPASGSTRWRRCRISRRATAPADSRSLPRPRKGGTSAAVKPSLPASLRRASAWPTGRTSPDRPISPKITVSAGIGRKLSADTSAAATARSAAGSAMRKPPATLR